MIHAADVLHSLMNLRARSAAEYPRFLPLVTDMISDLEAGRYYTGLTDRQPIHQTLGRSSLRLHSAFLIKAVTSVPISTRSIFPRFVGRINGDDAVQLLRMKNRFLEQIKDMPRSTNPADWPIPATTAGILFTGYCRGEFEPVVWVNHELTPAEFGCWLDVSLTYYVEQLRGRAHPSGGST